MLDRIDTWILLVILFGMLTCFLAAALGKIRLLQADLRSERSKTNQLRLELAVTRADLLTALRRDEAGRCHAVLLREGEIERLKEEITAWKNKYRVLERAMNQRWPKEV